MVDILQLKYDELRTIAKQVRDSGEDFTMLHAKTRDRVHDLNGMWMGDAADKFFEEMEIKYLPPLQRTAMALFAMQDVLLKIIRLIYDSDQETVGYFKRDLDQFGGSLTGAIGGSAGVDIGIGIGGPPFSQQQGSLGGAAGAAEGTGCKSGRERHRRS